MNNTNVEIAELETTYKIKIAYHSAKMDKDCTLKLYGVEKQNGKLTFLNECEDDEFMFRNSDPDLILALAGAMGAFAKMVKENNSAMNAVDTAQAV